MALRGFYFFSLRAAPPRRVSEQSAERRRDAMPHIRRCRFARYAHGRRRFIFARYAAAFHFRRPDIIST